MEVRGWHCHEFGAPKAGEHLDLVEATLLATAKALAPPRLYWVWKHQALAVSSPGRKGLAERLSRWLGAPRAVPCPGAPGLAVAAPGLAHQAVRVPLVWDGSVRTKCTRIQSGQRCRCLLRWWWRLHLCCSSSTTKRCPLGPTVLSLPRASAPWCKSFGGTPTNHPAALRPAGQGVRDIGTAAGAAVELPWVGATPESPEGNGCLAICRAMRLL